MMSAIDSIKKDKSLTQPVLLVFILSGSIGGVVQETFAIIDHRPVQIKSSDFFSAIETLFASFYTFNLKYPTSLSQVYGFFELLFGIPSTVTVTTGMRSLYSRISSES
jgi:hypothetical protein